MKTSLSFFLLFTLVSATAAPLSLDEALTRAASAHPRLLAQGARTDAAAALVEQAGYRPNPQLNVTLENFAGTGATRGTDALESTVEVSQVIERGDKRARRTAVAEQDRALATAETAVLRADILGATAQAYVAVTAAAQRAALAGDFVALARTTLAEAEARHAAGDASAAEPARARAALITAQAEAARQTVAFQLALTTLSNHWGGDAADATPAAVSLHLSETLPATDTWLTRLETHPRFALAQAHIASGRAALGLTQANAAQDFSIAGGLRHLRGSSDTALVAGVSLPLPVRHRNQGAIRAARQSLAGAEFESTATRRELRSAIIAATQELAAAHTAAWQLRRDAMPAVEEAAALLRRAYAAGQATQSEVLEAERTRNAVRRDLLDQETAYAAALVRAEALADPTFPLTRQLLATP